MNNEFPSPKLSDLISKDKDGPMLGMLLCQKEIIEILTEKLRLLEARVFAVEQEIDGNNTLQAERMEQ